MLPSSTSIKFFVIIKISYCRLAFLSSQHMREGIQLSHSKARFGQQGAGSLRTFNLQIEPSRAGCEQSTQPLGGLACSGDMLPPGQQVLQHDPGNNRKGNTG